MAKANLQKQIARAQVVVALIEKMRDEQKKLYAEADELALELVNVPALEAKGVRVVDNFAKGNTQWGHGPVRRLVLEAVEAPPASAKSSEGTRKRKASE
jgi:hypothetical protein